MMIRIWPVMACLLFTLSCKSQKGTIGTPDLYNHQVDSVLALMTLQEKIGQMTIYTTDWESTGPTIKAGYQNDIRTGDCGSLFNSHTVAFTRKLQEIAVNESRLGIPLLFGYDVIHGYKTIFPIPLAESCSWDMAAMEQSASIAAAESAAAGLHWTFAPMVDISREPRWGRVMEGAGEDPYLGSLVARARVKGFQGENFNGTDRILACIKHFAGYGAPIAGRDYNTVDMSERTFRDFYFPPYKAGIEAGARTVMTSFNDLDGIPSTGNKWLLEEVLRKENGFTGFIVTDYTSINEMVNHGYAADEKHAGELAANAGVDMDMQGGVFQRYLKESIAAGIVSEKMVDDAVRRILRIKFELGLFKDPFKFCNEQREKAVVFAPAHLEAARDIARKSIVLLKNDNKTLPLTKGKTIALVGPLAADRGNLIGAWSGAGEGDKCVSVLDAFQERAAKDGFKLMHAKGCAIEGTDTTGFAEAVRIGREADIIVAVIGENKDMSGEAAARAHITIPGMQEQFIKALVATGKPVVVVLMNGRPLTFPWISENADAIVEAWWLGSRGGPAIGDVLYGDYNPSGKLTMTFPRDIGQVPIYYNIKNTGRPYDPTTKWNSRYQDIVNTPQYPFGYGLSYTTFAYDSMVVARKDYSFNDTIIATVNVKNTGSVAGEEIVQCYVRDLVGSVTRPLKELKGFEKIKLAPGESKKVTFKLTSKDLAFYTADMTFKAEPGAFWVMVGPNSESLQKKEIRLVQ